MSLERGWPFPRLVEWVLFLVVIAGITTLGARTLGTGIPDARRDPATFTLLATRADAAQPAAASTLRVHRVLVDGRTLRLDEVAGNADWERYNEFGEGVPDELRFPSGATSRKLEFTARSFTLVTSSWEWPGSITVLRNGDTVRTMDYSLIRGTVARDDSPQGSMFFPNVFGLLLAVAVSWRYRPRAGHHLGLAWLVTALATIHLAYWLTQAIGTTDDSVGYLASAKQLFLGYATYFPPGYPLLLGIVEAVAGPATGSVVALLQHAMAVTAAAWIFLLLRRLVDRQTALLGGLMAGALPTMLAMPQAILTEGPTLFAMTGSLYFAVRAMETARARDAWVAGVFAGWAILLRVVPVVPIAPALMAVYLLPWATRRPRFLLRSAAMASAIVALPMTWFAIKGDGPALVTSVGHHLYNRVVAAQGLVDTTGATTGQLTEVLDGQAPPMDAWWEVAEEGKPAVFDDPNAREKLFRGVAIEGIRRNLGAYVAFVPKLAWMELMASQEGWIPSGGESGEVVDLRLESSRLVPVTAESLRWRWNVEGLQGRIWPAIVFVAIVGTMLGFLLRARPLVLALVAMPAGYLLCSAALDHFAARHVVPVTPFLLSLGAVTLGVVPMAIRALHPASARRTVRVVRAQARDLVHNLAAITPDD